MGDYCAFGQAGRAGGVQDGVQIVLIKRGLGIAGWCLRQGVFIGAVCGPVIEQHQFLDSASTFDFGGIGLELAAVKQQLRARIVDDELEFGHGQSPVERQKHGPQSGTSELDLENVAAVFCQHPDAVTAFNAERLLQ